MSGVSILLQPVGGEQGEEEKAADDEAVVEVTSDLCLLVPPQPGCFAETEHRSVSGGRRALKSRPS